jgi:hypothetical protein
MAESEPQEFQLVTNNPHPAPVLEKIPGKQDHSSTIKSAIQAKARVPQAGAAAEEDDDADDMVAGGIAGFFKSDAFQRIILTIQALIATYAAVMASMLSVFVPQLCCSKAVSAPAFAVLLLMLLRVVRL